MRILYTGGSSGGHTFSIIALHRELKEEAQKRKVLFEPFYCGADFLGSDFYNKEGITAYFIAKAKLRRYFSLVNFIDPFKFIYSLIKSLFVVWLIMPDIVFVKGGYDSVPVGLAAWIYRIPIVIHESDSIPGLANRILSRFSLRIAVSFSYTMQFFPAQKTALIGNLIRKKKENIKDIKKELNINVPLILVLGGSLGAQALNALIAKSLSHLLNDYFIVLQCGKNNFDEFSQELNLIYQIDPSETKNFKLVAFLEEDELASYLNAADLVISRAGAGSIFEIAQWGKPSILIPLPESASLHQQKNAFLYARTGAALILNQNNLTPELLISEIKNILNDIPLKEKMSKAAFSFVNQNATQILASEIFNILNISKYQNDSSPYSNEQSTQNTTQIHNDPSFTSEIQAQDKIFFK